MSSPSMPTIPLSMTAIFTPAAGGELLRLLDVHPLEGEVVLGVGVGQPLGARHLGSRHGASWSAAAGGAPSGTTEAASRPAASVVRTDGSAQQATTRRRSSHQPASAAASSAGGASSGTRRALLVDSCTPGSKNSSHVLGTSGGSTSP